MTEHFPTLAICVWIIEGILITLMAVIVCLSDFLYELYKPAFLD